VTFVSSGTEALNLVAIGLVARARSDGKRAHVVASAVEHKALLEPLAALARAGTIELELARVDEDGVLQPGELARLLRPGETVFAAAIAAQNETGVLEPLDELARVAALARVPLVVDAAQAVGRIDRDWSRGGWDYLVLSAHKLRAPRGAAALVRRRDRPAPEPLVRGGGQELGRRAGTEDVAAIAGLGEACARLQASDRASVERSLRARRDRFEARLLESIPGAASPAAARRGSRRRRRSSCPALARRTCSPRSTSPGSKRARAPPAARARSSRRTSSRPWACPRSSRAAS